MSKISSTNLVNQIIEEFQSGKNREAAFIKLKNFMIKNPQDTTALYNLAYMSEILGKKDFAIESYKKTIKLDPDHWKSMFNLYIIYIKQESYDTALTLVDSVLRIRPNYQPALRDKALILYYKNTTGK